MLVSLKFYIKLHLVELNCALSCRYPKAFSLSEYFGESPGPHEILFKIVLFREHHKCKSSPLNRKLLLFIYLSKLVNILLCLVHEVFNYASTIHWYSIKCFFFTIFTVFSLSNGSSFMAQCASIDQISTQSSLLGNGRHMIWLLTFREILLLDEGKYLHFLFFCFTLPTSHIVEVLCIMWQNATWI